MITKDIKGTVLITGANGGLATAFIDQLIQTNPPYLGVFTVRGASAQSSPALPKLFSNAKFPYSILPLDLDDLASVRNFAKDINSKVTDRKLPKIRALILNAAIQTFKGVTYTKDGIEMTFGVNYLANFLLVLLLLESMDPEMGRIVIVSSFTHDPEYSYNSNFATDKIVFKSPEVMARPQKEKGDQWAYGMRRYGLSKLLMLMFMYELQRRLDTDPKLHNITIMAMDPGGMPGTGISRDAPFTIRAAVRVLGMMLGFINYFFPNVPFRSTRRSAGDLLHASLDEEEIGARPKAVNLNGRVKEDTSAESRDAAKWKELWEGSVKLAELKRGDTVLPNWN